jgi:hypothetical protein
MKNCKRFRQENERETAGEKKWAAAYGPAAARND